MLFQLIVTIFTAIFLPLITTNRSSGILILVLLIKGINMKQLSVMEMDAISGGRYSWNFSSVSNAVTSVVTNGISAAAGIVGGAAAGAAIGTIIGGAHGGDGGGILGVGSIGQGVGMLYGLAAGAVIGGIAGGLAGFDDVYNYSTAFLDGAIEGTFTPWTSA
ncbi:hypothetical protein [Kluyvera cryocrescens]|uniref:hypothetical protein n=1 Tax=Kluyvera cryocrescens TaxID=580 RepID=UPI002DBBD60E|nr:hypothetical protein [Kluyvera cryocrescens]MEB6635164.1 hypothetical protein [Kluyvera cryocrescens]MEB7715107.1 hypothetical protein [Kluyvera cryocrescens]